MSKELTVMAAGRRTGKSVFNKMVFNYHRYVEQYTWCMEVFGPAARDRWWYNDIDGKFEFVNSEDEVFFRLRWQ